MIKRYATDDVLSTMIYLFEIEKIKIRKRKRKKKKTVEEVKKGKCAQLNSKINDQRRLC